MNQQIEQLLKTVQKRQAKISKEQSAMDEEIKQIEKMVEEENKSWKDYWKVPEKTFKDYVREYRKKWGKGNSAYPFYEEWDMKDKFGLLWYVIKDRGGDIKTFARCLNDIINRRLSWGDNNTKVFKIYKLLPKDFIESFRE